ncbi:8615_t:CDS:2 [Ambispora gerdemannii]|uniref:8615_t:CDS:1 n=1 Tax=Ambispora gerdemannii TaxID=144530 RepID=A0A9N9CT13_9GLOM|nr:8615_t:CDS:2 [Ambispora gerdemannii]
MTKNRTFADNYLYGIVTTDFARLYTIELIEDALKEDLKEDPKEYYALRKSVKKILDYHGFVKE